MTKFNSGIFLLLLGLLFTFSPASAQDPAEGEQLFQANCSSCHKLGAKLIGPNLIGVNERRSEEWLLKFIKNSQEVINSGDEYAVQLYEEYNKVIMPPMALSDDEVKSVLAYIEEAGAKEAEATAAASDGSAGSGSLVSGDITDDPMFKFLLASIVIMLLVIFGVAGKVLGASMQLAGSKAPNVNWTKVNAGLFVAFLIAMFAGIGYELSIHLDDLRPESASVHGADIDQLFMVTLIITGIVFVIVQVLLFAFSWMYKGKKGKKGLYYPVNDKLELFWTAIPAVVLAVLVLFGFKTWSDITAPAKEGTPQVEVFAYQFGWQFRYPGEDGKLGRSDFRLISATNPLGIDPDDPASADDKVVRELHFPNKEEINLKFRSRDVIHSFWLTHFRVQMYCQPGLKSQFKFTPSISTAEMRRKTGDNEFDYELACNQVCGAAHYNMKAKVVVEEQEEFDKWLSEQKTFDVEAAKGETKVAQL